MKFSEDGKFLGEIGTANGSKGSLDTDNVRGVAQIRFIPETNEMVAADGYGNHRVSVWDPQTLKFKRMWGAYGKALATTRFRITIRTRRSSATRCIAPSRQTDGLIYVCDRTNDRIQIFKDDGTYVKQFVLEPNTKGDGSRLGDRLLERSAAEVHVHLRRRQREDPCL